MSTHKAATGFVNVGCPGSNDPKVCLNCKLERCRLEDEPERDIERIPEEQMPEFSRWLRRMCREKHVSVRRLADETGLAKSTLSLIHCGKFKASKRSEMIIREFFEK